MMYCSVYIHLFKNPWKYLELQPVSDDKITDTFILTTLSIFSQSTFLAQSKHFNLLMFLEIALQNKLVR